MALPTAVAFGALASGLRRVGALLVGFDADSPLRTVNVI